MLVGLLVVVLVLVVALTGGVVVAETGVSVGLVTEVSLTAGTVAVPPKGD